MLDLETFIQLPTKREDIMKKPGLLIIGVILLTLFLANQFQDRPNARALSALFLSPKSITSVDGTGLTFDESAEPIFSYKAGLKKTELKDVLDLPTKNSYLVQFVTSQSNQIPEVRLELKQSDHNLNLPNIPVYSFQGAHFYLLSDLSLEGERYFAKAWLIKQLLAE